MALEKPGMRKLYDKAEAWRAQGKKNAAKAGEIESVITAYSSGLLSEKRADEIAAGLPGTPLPTMLKHLRPTAAVSNSISAMNMRRQLARRGGI